jgi:exo-beta-1,3-glucanase (GH17 family)
MNKLIFSSFRLHKCIGIYFLCILSCAFLSCGREQKQPQKETIITAEEILGNPAYPAISYGGYRAKSRKTQPTLSQIKNDLRILYAIGIRLVRTYNLQFEYAPNVIKAIEALKRENCSFEMYVMLGTWIDCKGARTRVRDHSRENLKNNTSEIEKAISLANQYPQIVKIIAVGNEAMVHWQEAYYVTPSIILKWVNYLQGLKKEGKLPSDLWITSSDNFASWGGGDNSYHKEALTQLIQAVDYLSIHTYPFHDTHYNPSFWETNNEATESKKEKIEAAMDGALAYAIEQYNAVEKYLEKLGIDKPIHIGETGWSTKSKDLYGNNGSRAADEIKQALYYHKMQQWSRENKITNIYFSAFDEPWKDPNRPLASENNFGLFTVEGKAKYALWSLVDKGTFNGLSREENRHPIQKTFEGNKKQVFDQSQPPKTKK